MYRVGVNNFWELAMDRIASWDRNVEFDIESGLRVSVEDSSKDHVSGVKLQAKALLGKVCGVFVDGAIKVEETVNLAGNVANSNGGLVDIVKSGEEKSVDHLEKKVVKNECKRTMNKKSPKPPRPPRGPSMDAADQKLIKEITELAMLKRARIERMKSLKKMKAAKLASSSSSNGNLFAMVFTILFCLVILFQGMSSSGTSAIEGSTVSAEMKESGLISVQYSGHPTASDLNGPGSGSPNLVELIAGLDPSTNLRRASRKSIK